MKAVERGQQESVVIIVILIIGFIFVILAGQFALRFAPSWQMKTSMDSNLDPNSEFLTRRPSGLLEPVDASILTQPSWVNFLTPGVSVITRTPFPPQTPTFSTTQTIAPTMTTTGIVTKSPTSTFVSVPATRTPTSRAGSTATRTPTVRSPSTATSTATRTIPPTAISQTSTATRTPNLTFTATFTASPTRTLIATATQTATVTATATTTATATASPTATISPTVTSTATDTITPTATATSVPGIGTTPDGVVYTLPAGGSLILNINLLANGDGNYDLVYYERPAPTGGINLDWVIVEIGDGINWYPVFNWGDNIADTNTNMDFNILPNPQVPPETDQRNIPAASLYNGTGVAINVDAVAPPGTYTYIRFSAPLGDSDGQMEIDAVQVLP